MGSNTPGASCLHVRMMAATAPAEANDGQQDTRCAANVRQVPRLLPAMTRAPPGCVMDAAGHDAVDSWAAAGGCYLVTGGLGALGLAAAGWLLAAGASEVHLSSRSAAAVKLGSSGSLAVLLRHAPASALIVISQGDVAAPDDLISLQQGLAAPLRGAMLTLPSKLTMENTHSQPVLVAAVPDSDCSIKMYITNSHDDAAASACLLLVALQVSCTPVARLRMACWAGRRHRACAPPLQANSAALTGS